MARGRLASGMTVQSVTHGTMKHYAYCGVCGHSSYLTTYEAAHTIATQPCPDASTHDEIRKARQW